MRKKCVLFFTILFFCNQLFAGEFFSEKNEKQVVTGSVFDKENGQPLSFVNVSIPNQNIGTLTNEKGQFVLENCTGSNFSICFSFMGYKTISKTVNLPVKNLHVEMQEDMIGLDQVVVSADRSEVSRKDAPVVVNSISKRLLSQSGACTLVEGVTCAPGIRIENNCSNCGFNQIRMNGLEGNYSQILINSRPIISGLAAVYGVEHIPVSLIDRIEIVRGGGSALFGSNAIAGTINVITKDPIKNSFSLSNQTGILGVGTKDHAADISTNLNGSIVSKDHKTGLFLFATHRDRKAYDANGDGFSNLVKIQSKAIGMQAFRRFSQRSKLSVEYHFMNEFRRGGDHLSRKPYNSEIAEQVEHDIHAGGITWDYYFDQERKHKLSTFTSLQFTDRATYYGAQLDEDENGNALNPKQPDYSAYGKTEDFVSVTGVQYSGKLNQFLFAPSRLVVGLENSLNLLKDTKLGYTHPVSLEKKEDILISDQRTNTLGMYAQNTWKLGKANIVAGARLDHYQIKNKADNSKHSNFMFAPRVNVQYKLTDQINLRSSYSKGYRAPQIFDEDLHIEASAARKIVHQLADHLKEETSHSFMTSLDFDFRIGSWDTYFLAEAFYTRLNNPFVNDYQEDSKDSNTLIAVRSNTENATVKGVNLEFKMAASVKFDYQLGFTFQNGKYNKAINQGEETFTDKMLRSPSQYGYLLVNYQPYRNTIFSLNGNYTGAMHLVHLAHKDKQGNEVAEKLVETPQFFELACKVSQEVKLNLKLKLVLDAGVKNLFNSYQDDFDWGASRDATYVYGPVTPRTVYVKVKLMSL